MRHFLLALTIIAGAAFAAAPAAADGFRHHPKFRQHHPGFRQHHPGFRDGHPGFRHQQFRFRHGHPAFRHHPGFSRPRSSVFPVPHDPWRSWGLRSELPRRVGPPPAVIFAPTPVPGPVWVPGRWFWDGAAWVWWPGRWVR